MPLKTPAGKHWNSDSCSLFGMTLTRDDDDVNTKHQPMDIQLPTLNNYQSKEDLKLMPLICLLGKILQAYNKRK